METDNIELNGCKFIIKKEGEYFMVYSASDHVYPWLDRFNCRSMINKFNRSELETQLNKQIKLIPDTKKIVESKDKLKIKQCKQSKCYEQNKKYDQIKHMKQKVKMNNMNVMCIKESNRIRGFIDTSIKNTPFSKSSLGIGNSVNDKKTSLQIFNRKQCADIITTDYINLYCWLKTSFGHDTECIDIINESIYEWRIKINHDDINQLFGITRTSSTNSLLINEQGITSFS